MSLYLGIALLAVILIVNAFMFSFEAAFEEFNDPEMENKLEEGDRKAKTVECLMSDSGKLNNAIYIVSFATTIIGGGYILRNICDKLREYGSFNLMWILTSIALLLLLMVFGVVIPRRIGHRKANKLVYAYCGIVRFVCIIVVPVRIVIYGLAWIFLKPFGISIRETDDNVTEEEIITMVNEGQEQGVLEAGEAEMITNIFEMGEKNAGDIMTHRAAIVAVECHMTLEQLIQKHIDGNFSRLPVYDGDIDNIVGTLHIRDALILYRTVANRKKQIIKLADLIRKPFFVPNTRDIDDLLREMQMEKVHIGIVIDEYGQTDGIISMEDIIEEIVGNITDEYDEEAPDIFVQKREDRYEVEGLTRLDELGRLLDHEIESDDFDTLNGYLLSLLGKIPEKAGYVAEDDKFRYKILEVSGNVIRKVQITRLDEEAMSKDE